MRVTDEKVIKIVEEVLLNEINPDLVNTIQQYGAKAESVTVKKNNIIVTGPPFITHYSWNNKTKTTIFSICVPVEEEILTTDGSEISGGHFDAFLAMKTTLCRKKVVVTGTPLSVILLWKKEYILGV